MKKLFTVLSMLFVVFWGCQDSSVDIAGPDQSPQINKTQNQTFSIIQLPESLTPRPLHKKIDFTITPQNGGTIEYEDSYNSATGKVKVQIKLKFLPHSVDETIVVSVDIDNNQLTGVLSMVFGPSPKSFLKPALLSVEASGLEASSLPSDPKAIKMVYWDSSSNSYIEMNVKKIKLEIDGNKGELEVKDGEVPHFSRYAFIT